MLMWTVAKPSYNWLASLFEFINIGSKIQQLIDKMEFMWFPIDLFNKRETTKKVGN